jgi:endonuclease YncB( thermonuclease family)
MHLVTLHEFSTYTHLMRLAALLAFVVWSFTVSAEMLEGRVVGVADGDTLTLLDDNQQQHRIRLAGIDAPEKAQPFGQRSKQHLAEFAFGKDAKADCYKIDRYDRNVCTVFVNGQDVGLAQLDAGLAWWYRKYAYEQPPKERIDYEAAEDRAAADRTGLWQDANPVPPWEWRHKHR